MTVKQAFLNQLKIGTDYCFSETLDDGRECNRYLTIIPDDLVTISTNFDDNLHGHWGDGVMTTIKTWYINNINEEAQ